MEELYVGCSSVAGHQVLTPIGAIDRFQVDRFRTVVYQAVLSHPVVIIDLSRVSMLGPRGAGALALAGHVAARDGCRMLVAAPSQAVAGTLRRTGAAIRLEMTDSVTAAVACVTKVTHQGLEVTR